MNILERDIEDLVYETAIKNPRALFDRGLDVLYYYKVFARQVDIGSYGRADMLCFTYSHALKKLEICVVEFKKDQINAHTFLQSVRYAKGLKELIYSEFGLDCDFRYCLIGTSVDTVSDFIFMPDLFPSIDIFTVKLDLLSGLTFKNERNYSHTNFTILNDRPGLAKMVKSMIFGAIRKYVNTDPF